MQIASGSFSYQTAVKNAIANAVRQGVTVFYPSGVVSKLDAAVRRSVLTGMNQTAGRLQIMRAEEMECDLMELSAHAGARPGHAEWQGQIVSRSGKPGYLTLDDIGYGRADGFMGVNCRHNWYLYFGGARANTREMLDEYKNHTVEYDGKTLTDYEACQKQRQLERSVRAQKQKLVCMNTAVNETNGQELKNALRGDFDRESAVLKKKEEKLNDFCRQTVRRNDTFRTQVYGFDRSISAKAVWGNKKYVDKSGGNDIIKSRGGLVALENQRYGRNKDTLVNKTYIESGEYRRKFDNLTDNPAVNKALYECAKVALKHRSGTKLEDMYWIDGDTCEIIAKEVNSTTEQNVIYSKNTKKSIQAAKDNDISIVTIHTHPSSMPPSAADFNSCYRNNYKNGVIACHDGKLYSYTSKQEINEAVYNLYIQGFIMDGFNEFDSQIKALEKLKQNHMIEFWEVF